MPSVFLAHPNELLKRVSFVYRFLGCNTSLFHENGTSFFERTCESIINSYLWFSPLESFNDAFEGRVKYRYASSLDEVVDIEAAHEYGRYDEIYSLLQLEYEKSPGLFMGKHNEKYLKFYEERVKAIKEKGYCCFLTEFIGKSFSRRQDALMWGHYADGMRGIRLGFDLASLVDSLPNADFYFMEYKSEPEGVNLPFYYKIQNGLQLGSPRMAASFDEHSFLTKYKAWSYESELRIRSPLKGPVHFNPEALAQVAFGERVDSRAKSELVSILISKNPNIKLYDALRADSAYSLKYARFY